MKVAFLFSGQGSQTDSLFKSFYEKSNLFAEKIHQLQQYTDIDLIESGNRYSRQQTKSTRIIQPTLLAKQLAITDILSSRGIVPTVVAGMSLGQFSAMHASGMISASFAMRLIEKRSLLMSRDIESTPTAMVAILSNDMEKVFKMIQLKWMNNIYPSNFNSETQVVFGGSKTVVHRLADNVNESAIGKAIILNTEGAFHTPYFANTEKGLKKFLIKHPKFSADIPLIENETGEAVYEMTTGGVAEHSIHPVMWWQSMLTLENMHPDFIIEIGSGSPLRKLIPKTIQNYITIETYEDLLRLYSLI